MQVVMANLTEQDMIRIQRDAVIDWRTEIYSAELKDECWQCAD